MASIRDAFVRAVKSGDLDQVKKKLTDDKDLIHDSDSDALTPLHHAAWRGHEKIVEYLLSQSIQNLDSTSYQGMTPLLCAASYGYPKVIELLLQCNADVNKAEWTGKSALHYIANEVDASDDQEKIDLNLECMALLLANRANVNQQNNLGETPLMNAKNIQIFKAFLVAKPNLEIKDHSGNTVFLNACKTLHTKKIKLLIDAKADINAVNIAKKSALDLMLESDKNRFALKKNVKLLLQLRHPAFLPVLIEQAFQEALTKENTNFLQFIVKNWLKAGANQRFKALFEPYKHIWNKEPKLQGEDPERIVGVSIATSPYVTFKIRPIESEKKPLDEPAIVTSHVNKKMI